MTHSSYLFIGYAAVQAEGLRAPATLSGMFLSTMKLMHSGSIIMSVDGILTNQRALLGAISVKKGAGLPREAAQKQPIRVQQAQLKGTAGHEQRCTDLQENNYKEGLINHENEAQESVLGQNRFHLKTEQA
ncbi:hypothetical protein UY3_01315 [Chelonia mydas]|uniref:Uncharacterized protein n=1 Tax=Chelonia mydas TaxID=8469 RepID=M7BW66_CHEMY|nr:hypothetical protein UY3_01315 [Chelonia mydas]